MSETLLKSKEKAAVQAQKPDSPQFPSSAEQGTYPQGEPVLPKHFSALSAQKGEAHNDVAHRALGQDLKMNGFNPEEVEGHYGHPEKSYMVPHNGSPEKHRSLEQLAFKKYNQESVIHSSQGQNRLVHANGDEDWVGQGHTHGNQLKDYFTRLASGHKFQLNVAPQKKEQSVKKSEKAEEKELKKPHYYGVVDGVHVYHATSENHRQSLIGDHIDSPTQDEFKTAVKKAKKAKTMVVIHGAAPDQLRAKIHPELGASIPGKVNKSELAKAFLQPDGETKTDLTAHAAALSALPKELMEWGTSKLVPMQNDGVETHELKGHTIKVRKLSADQYSGWVEKDGNKIHGFERVTLPEMMIQLQSKLEMYDAPKKEEPKDLIEAPEEDSSQAEAQAQTKDLGDKLKELRAKLAEKLGQDHPELGDDADTGEVHVAGKDLMEGLENPEEECPACAEPADKCVCYSHLPMPQIKVDSKGVHIFFKSESWSVDDRENFVEDLKRRAGRIIKRRSK